MDFTTKLDKSISSLLESSRHYIIHLGEFTLALACYHGYGTLSIPCLSIQTFKSCSERGGQYFINVELLIHSVPNYRDSVDKSGILISLGSLASPEVLGKA